MDDLDELGGRLLVIFDGHCGLCNRSIRWFLVRDKLDRLRFVASDSPKVSALLVRHGIATAAEALAPSTILVVRDAGGPDERLLVRSEGVLAMLAELPSPWSGVARFLKWIPRPLRDLGYRIIARWRYCIWGRLDSCPVPTMAERRKFL